MENLILPLIHTYNLYSQIPADGLQQGALFYLNMTKTVQAQYMSFNKLPQHISMSDSLGLFNMFKRQLGVLYKSHLFDFDINNRCT